MQDKNAHTQQTHGIQLGDEVGTYVGQSFVDVGEYVG